MDSQINDLVRQHQSWMRFLRSAAIASAIAQYKDQVNDMRSNFILDVVVRIYMRIAEGQRPRHLAFTSALIYLIDAMNDTSSVPMDYCSSPEDFADFVKFRFRNRLGHQVIERGAFTFSLVEVDGTQRTLGQNPGIWRSLINPEVTITMDILVSGVNDADVDSRQCPSCRVLCTGASLGDRVQCPRCGTLFYVARGIIEEVGEEDGGRNSASHEDLDESHFRYFRRFRVLLEEATTIAADIANNSAEELQHLKLEHLKRVWEELGFLMSPAVSLELQDVENAIRDNGSSDESMPSIPSVSDSDDELQSISTDCKRDKDMHSINRQGRRGMENVQR
ncbi:hypothetical protein DXG01_012384 [Tephrocybe rancida]|nr:hypothetical protein DXG01_012384 [Tephrocybe rancida]